MKEPPCYARSFSHASVGKVNVELGYWVPVCRQQAISVRGEVRSQNVVGVSGWMRETDLGSRIEVPYGDKTAFNSDALAEVCHIVNL